ncbi:nuclear pore complex protein DDB_G0274915-like [Leptopilina heterotoma]|uniref:nuclear pore complex protein DDB_G0274915-like n=1 Tax=Leptopilina heterotoma TaxID=63436 RepID=UPI001CA7F6B0|nr:nuclear pore complex protein DDB_G0274915-like [Leptopilina heterotoma]
MASDFSSECNDAIAIFDDEKEEGEISLDDVSSSEEGHINYQRRMEKFRDGRLQLQPHPHHAPTEISSRYNSSKLPYKKDAEQGKENHHLIKDTGHMGDRLTNSTLQEKNDDLIPISSDSDMELVGLPKRVRRGKSSKVKKKKKKRKPHSASSVVDKDDESIANEIDENLTIMELNNSTSSKENRLLKPPHHHYHHHRDKSPQYKMKISPKKHKSSSSSLIETRLAEKKIKSPIHRSTEMRKRIKKFKPLEKIGHKELMNPLYKKIRKRPSPTDIVSSSPSTDIHVTSLLKKVRHYEMVGTLEDSKVSSKARDHGTSLKDKLNNILKPTAENNDNKETENIADKKKNENGDEEEDLNILRQKALETKQSKSKNQEANVEEITENSSTEIESKDNSIEEKIAENTNEEVKENKNKNKNEVEDEEDGDDDEDLKLRLIALRSAVYKKHRDRVAKLQKDKEAAPPRCESPFSESFINNISLAEDVDEFPSNSSETAKDSNNSIEDMELDSDIESDIVLEKENVHNEDKVSREIVNTSKMVNSEKTDLEKVSSPKTVNFDEAPYSPTDAVNSELILEAEQLGIDTTDVSLININSKNFCKFGSYLPVSNKEKIPTANASSIISNSSNSDVDSRTKSKNSNFERPYSPSDIPVFDPDLNVSLLGNNNFFDTTASDNNNFSINDNFSKEPEVILIDDDFPDIDIDGSPLVPMEKESNLMYPGHISYQLLQPSYQSLCLNGIPPFVHNQIVQSNPLVQSNLLNPQSRFTEELPIGRTYENSSVPPINEFIPEHFNSSQMPSNHPMIELLRINPHNQQSKENLSINRPEVDFDFDKSTKKPKRRKRSKRHLIECDEPQNPKSPNSTEDSIQSAKRIKNSNTEPNYQKSLFENTLEITVRKNVEDIVRKYTENVIRECTENNIRKDVENIVRQCTEHIVRENSENNLRKGENLSRKDLRDSEYLERENNLREETEKRNEEISGKDEENRTKVQKNSNSNSKEKEKDENRESRRNSVDEDEDELRAILLASMGKRTKSPKVNKFPMPTKSKEVVQNLSVASTSKKSTETTSGKSILNSTNPQLTTSPKEILLSKEISVPKNLPQKAASKDMKNLSPKEIQQKSDSSNESTKVLPTISSVKILPKSLPIILPKVLPILPKISSARVLTTILPTEDLTKIATKESTKIPTKVLPQKTAAKANQKIQEKVSPSKIQTQKLTKISPTKNLTNRILSTKITINNSLATTNSTIGKRKATSCLLSGTPRKLMKKPMIPASTKVVNNAKRYQNSLMQRKLNLQKAILTLNAKKIIANKSLRVVNLNSQNNRSLSPNITSANNQSERFIISLNSDSESDSETERRNTIVAVTNNSSVEKRPTLTIPTTEFERSVDQFLRDVRKRQESAAAKQSTSLTKTLPPPNENGTNGNKVSANITPLALRHLPVSQQAEYHRLKQQIVEREKLKLQRSTAPGSTSNTNSVIPPDPPVSVSVTCPTPKATSTPSSSLTSSSSSETNISKTNTIKKSPVDIPPSSSSENTLAPTIKSNITVQITNIGTSPKKSVKISSPISNILEEKPKEPTFPKLRILTCEQINLKLLQVQVSQNDEGRKIIVGTNNEEQTNLDDSVIILSEETCDTRDNSETSVQKRINTETPIVALSTNSTTPACDNTTTSTRISVEKNSDKESNSNESEISKQASTAKDDLSITKDGEKSKEQTSGIKLTVEKETTVENSIVKETRIIEKELTNAKTSEKEPTTAKISEKKSTAAKTSEKESTTAKISEKESTIAKISEKESTTNKESMTVEESNSRKEPIVSKTVESEQKESEKSNLKENNDASKVPSKEKGQQVWDVIKNNVQTEVETVTKLGNEEMKRKLVETEQELVAKRYEVLDDLAEVSKSLRQWELEKDLQSNLTEEVKKLVEQLRLTEEKLQEQKDKVTNMGLKVSTVHEKMNIGRKECFRLSKICTGLGNRIYGQKYKVPESGVQLVNNRLKEVAQHTSQLCKKKNDKRRKISATSTKSNGKESDTSSQITESNSSNTINQASNSTDSNQITNSQSTTQQSQVCDENISSPMEGQNSCESISTSGSSSKNHKSAEVVKDHVKTVNSSRNEIVSLDVPSCSKNINTVSDNVSQSQVKQTNEVNDSLGNKKTIDSSSSRMDNNDESSVTCHMEESSVSNQISGADVQTKKKTMRPYVSILDHMKTARNSRADGILCPYQLMGSCQDADCQYVHHTPSH